MNTERLIVPKTPEEILAEGRDILCGNLALDNTAVIFDLDSTLIALEKAPIGKRVYSNGELITTNYLVKPIEPIVELWNLSAELGYKTFLVTARVCGQTTLQDLQQVTAVVPTQIFFRAGDAISPWASKRYARELIYSQHTVVMNIGDSVWDVSKDPSAMFCGGTIPDEEPLFSALVKT